MAERYAAVAELGSSLVRTSLGEIEVLERGSGSPVLVVHGIWGGVDQGILNVRGMLEQGFRALYISRFGYLRSPLPTGATPELQADLLAALLKDLDIHRVQVIAHSAGATSALCLAIRHPDLVQSLVLISPNSPGKVEFRGPPRLAAEFAFRSDFLFWWLTTYGTAMLNGTMGVPPGFPLSEPQKALVAELAATVLPARLRYRGALFDAFVSNPAVNTLAIEQIGSPALVVAARDDPMALYRNSEALAQRLEQGELLTVDNGGHMLLGHDRMVLEGVRRFLEAHAV